MKRPSLWENKNNGIRQSTKPYNEIDLRKGFDDLVFGIEGKIPHGHWVILRNVRYDENHEPTECVCLRNKQTIESDILCSYCSGEGYLWDEQWIYCYSMHSGSDSGLARKYISSGAGEIKTDYVVFFLRYDTIIREKDKIIEVLLDTEGEIIQPFVRTNYFEPSTIIDFRADNGRIEYIMVFCKEESSIKKDIRV